MVCRKSWIDRGGPIWSDERNTSTWELLGMTGHEPTCPFQRDTPSGSLLDLHYDKPQRQLNALCVDCGGVIAFLPDRVVVGAKDALQKWCDSLALTLQTALTAYQPKRHHESVR